MKYRTISQECFVCGYKTGFKIALRGEMEVHQGFYREALGALACPKCRETALISQILGEKKEEEKNG